MIVWFLVIQEQFLNIFCRVVMIFTLVFMEIPFYFGICLLICIFAGLSGATCVLLNWKRSKVDSLLWQGQ